MVQAGKDSALLRRTDDALRNFISKIDTDMAFLKLLVVCNFVLNSLLRCGANPDFKTAVILGVAANQSYEFIRHKVLMVVPHPAQRGGGIVTNFNSSGNNSNGGRHNSHGQDRGNLVAKLNLKLKF